MSKKNIFKIDGDCLTIIVDSEIYFRSSGIIKSAKLIAQQQEHLHTPEAKATVAILYIMERIAKKSGMVMGKKLWIPIDKVGRERKTNAELARIFKPLHGFFKDMFESQNTKKAA